MENFFGIVARRSEMTKNRAMQRGKEAGIEHRDTEEKIASWGEILYMMTMSTCSGNGKTTSGIDDDHTASGWPTTYTRIYI